MTKYSISQAAFLSGIFLISYVLMLLQGVSRKARNVGFDLDYYADASTQAVNNYKLFINYILSTIPMSWLFVGFIPLVLFLLIVEFGIGNSISKIGKVKLYRSLLIFTPFLYLSSSGYRDLIISGLFALAYVCLVENKYLKLIFVFVLMFLLRDLTAILIAALILAYYVKQRLLLIICTPILIFFSQVGISLLDDNFIQTLGMYRNAYAVAILNSNSNLLPSEFFDLIDATDLISSGFLYYCLVILFWPFLSILNLIIFLTMIIATVFVYNQIGFNKKLLVIYTFSFLLYINVYCLIGYAPSALVRHFCIVASAFWIANYYNFYRKA